MATFQWGLVIAKERDEGIEYLRLRLSVRDAVEVHVGERIRPPDFIHRLAEGRSED